MNDFYFLLAYKHAFKFLNMNGGLPYDPDDRRSSDYWKEKEKAWNV